MWKIQSTGEHGVNAVCSDGRTFDGTAIAYRQMLDNEKLIVEQQRLRDEAIALGGVNLDVELQDNMNMKESS